MGGTGLLNGDSAGGFSVLVPIYSGANALKVGTYGVSASGLVALGYSSSVSNGQLTVGAKSLSVSGLTATSKIYDGNSSASLSAAGSLVGVLSGDVVSFSTVAAFNNPRVQSTKTLTLTHTLVGTDQANYSLPVATGVATTALISPRPVQLTALAASKVYGDADPVFSYTIESAGIARGLVAGDSFTGQANRQAGKNTGVYAIGQGTVGNTDYAVTWIAANLSITPKPVLLAPKASAKVYDGTTQYVPDASDLSYLSNQLGVAGDTVSASSLTFDTLTAGQRKTLTLNSVVIEDGNQGRNYNVSLGANSDSAIQRNTAVDDAQDKVSGSQQAKALPIAQDPAAVPPPLVLPASTVNARSSSAGITVDVRNAPPSNPASAGVMAAVSLPNGTAISGSGFSFDLPPSIQALPRENSTARASLVDGSALPAWLKFDAQRLRFESSAVPEGAFPMQLAVSIGAQRVLVVISERTN